MADMKELIRRRLGLAGGGTPTSSSSGSPASGTKPKPERSDSDGDGDVDVDHDSEGPRRPNDAAAAEREDQTQPSVCDCGRCQEFVATKRPARPPAGRGGRGGGRGSRGRGGSGNNPWGVQNQPNGGVRSTPQQGSGLSDDEDGGAPTACASCGCDLIKHVVPGQLEDEDGFEDEDYDPVYGEHDD